jgi:hypothetical protein
LFFPAGLALLFTFGWWEKWNDKNQYTHEGDKDWWEAFFIYCLGITILWVFTILKITNIRWY